MILWITAAFAGYFVKGICGFANTLVLTGILSFSADNVNITPVDLILSYGANAAMAFKERKHIKWRVALPLALLVLMGCLPGAFLLKTSNVNVIKIAAGGAIILAALVMLARNLKAEKADKNAGIVQKDSIGSKLLTLFIAIVSGILSGLYGIGALMSVCVSRVTENSHQFKANMSLIFFAEGTFRIILYSCIGILNLQLLLRGLMLLPVSLAGLFCGMKLSGRIDESKAKYVVIFFLILSGIVLILNNI